jgi:hypothetical protein
VQKRRIETSIEAKVSETPFDVSSSLLCGSSPGKGRLHADQHVRHGLVRLGTWDEHVTIGFRARLHSLFKLSVCNLEASIESHN